MFKNSYFLKKHGGLFRNYNILNNYNTSSDRFKKWLQDKVCISSEQAIDVIVDEFNNRLQNHNNGHHKLIYQNCIAGINHKDIKTQQVNFIKYILPTTSSLPNIKYIQNLQQLSNNEYEGYMQTFKDTLRELHVPDDIIKEMIITMDKIHKDKFIV